MYGGGGEDTEYDVCVCVCRGGGGVEHVCVWGRYLSVEGKG